MSKYNISISRVLGDAALKAQRQGWIRAFLPPSARRRLGTAAASMVKRFAGEPVDDWSRPLIGASSQVATPTTAARPTEVVHPRSTSIHATEAAVPPEAPRCLLATSALDNGGMDRVVAFLALRLRSHGFRTAVLHTHASLEQGVKGRLGRMLSAAGIEVAVAQEAAARQWIREWGPDVISSHDTPDWVLEEARASAVPYVAVLHGMHSLFDCDWNAEAERSRDMTAIAAVSEINRQQYLRAVPTFPSERIVTIPNGIVTITNGVDDRPLARHDRLSARAAFGLQEEFLFVCLARHCSQKNQFGLLSAFDEVAARHPDAHLLLAGRVEEPVYFTQLRRERDRLIARDRVHLRDHATDTSLVLAAADGFVLNSFFEGWALASMEALYAGVPVVSSDVGGAREQLGTDPSRGYLVGNPLGDPLEVNWSTIGPVCYGREQANREELIDAMCALVREREQRAARREELAAESAARFDPDRCVRAHADLLHSCATGRIGRCKQAA